MSDDTMTKGDARGRPDERVLTEVAVATANGLRFLDGDGSGERDVELAGRDVTAIEDGPNGLLALVEGREVHLSSKAGGWDAVAELDGDGVGRRIVAHRGEVYVGGAEARLWRLVGDRLERVRSFDRAPTHDEWHTPWGGPPDIYSFASDGTRLYVGVHVGGILRTDDGERWEPTIDLHDDVHQVTLGDDGTVWAATGMRALARSTDRGATWTYFRDGLHGTYALAVAVGAAGPIVSVSSGPFARDGRVYRLVGEQLVRVEGLPDDFDGAVGIGRLVAAGQRAAVGLPNGEVYVSDDGGATWSLGAAASGEVHQLALIARR